MVSSMDISPQFSLVARRPAVAAVPLGELVWLKSVMPRLGFDNLITLFAQARPYTPAVAVEIYKIWLEIHGNGAPGAAGVWFNLGVELSQAGDRANSATAYQNALLMKPDLYQAAYNLGMIKSQAGDLDGALSQWRSALQPDEARTMLLNQIGRVLEEKRDLDGAQQTLYRSLLTNPQQPDAIQHWSLSRQAICAWPIFGPPVPGMTPEELKRNSGPLAALSLFDRIEDQIAVAAEWLGRKVPPTPAMLAPPEGYQHDRVRIGYMSSDFCAHAMSFLIVELLERHDRSMFEVFGYCSSREDGSAIRRRVLSALDHHVPVAHLNDAQLAQRIRADEIDILIDLNGMTKGARLETLRWKPAPVQATYLGYIGGLPLPELDYLIADRHVIPPEVADKYHPKPLYLDDLYQANDSRPPELPAVSREGEGLPTDKFIFCSFSNYYKLSEEMFDTWMEILRRVDHGVLWIVNDNAKAKENILARAALRGVTSDRLIFAGRVAPDHYRARMALADLFLDTTPYNAGTVATDALRVGLPLLTLQGEPFASRMASALLTAVGLPELVTTDRHSYIEMAVSLAHDPIGYRALRARLDGGEAWARTIGNTERFTRQFEAAMLSVVKRPS